MHSAASAAAMSPARANGQLRRDMTAVIPVAARISAGRTGAKQ
jgi:hypothetical protein